MLDYFSEYLRQNSSGRSERSSGSYIGIGGIELMTPLDQFFLGGVAIYKLLPTSQCTVQLEMAMSHFKNAEGIAILKKVKKDEVLTEICNYDVWKARLQKS